VQQRSVEYGNLFGYDQVRRGVLERMPPPEIREEQRVLGEATKKRHSRAPAKKKASQITENDLLDLMGGDTNMPATDMSAVMNGNQHNADLLADILGGDNTMSSPIQQSASPLANGQAKPQGNMGSIMDLFDSQPAAPTPSVASSTANDIMGGGGYGSPPPQQQAQQQAHTAYNKNDLFLTFTVQRTPQAVQVLARFRNQSAFESFSAVNLQAAVPKTQKLQLQAISSSELQGGQEATQGMRVTSVQGPPPPRLRLRLKVIYAKGGGAPVTEQVDWAEPA